MWVSAEESAFKSKRPAPQTSHNSSTALNASRKSEKSRALFKNPESQALERLCVDETSQNSRALKIFISFFLFQELAESSTLVYNHEFSLASVELADGSRGAAAHAFGLRGGLRG